MGAVLLAAPLFIVAGGAAAGDGAQGDIVDVGRELYLRDCASCHGDAATGYGPVSRLLRERPADLTVIAGRTRPFDAASIRSVITGRIRLETPSAIDEMPVWRHGYGTAVPASEGIVKEFDALLAYLESIQRQPFGAIPGLSIEDLTRAGAPLFAVHCSACHGPDGRGISGPGYVVGVAAPDLTTIALRNGGTVDMRWLFEAIARGDGDRTGMPAWGHAFKKAGWPDVVGKRSIEALAWYVESLQQRAPR